MLGSTIWAAFNEPRADHLHIIEALIAAGARVEPEWRQEIDELRQRANANE